MTLLDSDVRGDAADEPSDAELIRAVRAGDRSAYGMLYERHLASARAHARRLTWSAADADDLVAESFAKLFTVLRNGHGPDSAFRAYLLTVLRNGFYQRLRDDRRLEFTDDMGRHDQGVAWSDPVEAELNSSLAARAFAALPARWRTVLWQSEVEGRSTAEIGEQLDLRPNAVAALAYRAREGLRQAYLQAHLGDLADEDCRPAVRRLGGWTRGTLGAGDTALVREHLDGCDRCRGLVDELADVNDGIGGLLAPLAVLGPAAGYASATVATASVGGSIVGSALGWLLGTSGSQAAVGVLAAVVVGGTAVAGTVVNTPGHSPRPAAVAVVDPAGRPVEVAKPNKPASAGRPAKAPNPNKAGPKPEKGANAAKPAKAPNPNKAGPKPEKGANAAKPAKAPNPNKPVMAATPSKPVKAANPNKPVKASKPERERPTRGPTT